MVFLSKKDWAKAIFRMKIIIFTLIGWLFVMLPMLLYDISHGFPQTFKVLTWVGYRVLVFFGYSPINPITPVSFSDMINFITESYKQMIFAENGFVAFAIFTSSVFFLLFQCIKRINRKALVLLGVLNLFLILGLFVAKTPSGAYLPMVVPGVLLLIALTIERLIVHNRKIVRFFGGNYFVKYTYSQ